jgi:hypothetical protein
MCETLDDDLGWTDPVGLLQRLQNALRILAEGRGETAVRRVEAAARELAVIRLEEFPPQLRERATEVLGFLKKHADSEIKQYLRLHRLNPRDRKTFVANLMVLYEACLIDIGRTWPRWNFVYPG